MILRTFMLLLASTVPIMTGLVADQDNHTFDAAARRYSSSEAKVDSSGKIGERDAKGATGATGAKGATGATGADVYPSGPFAQYAVDTLGQEQVILGGALIHGAGTFADSDGDAVTNAGTPGLITFTQTLQNSPDGNIAPLATNRGNYILQPGVYFVKYRVDGSLNGTVTVGTAFQNNTDPVDYIIGFNAQFDLSLANATGLDTPVVTASYVTDVTSVNLHGVQSAAIVTLGPLSFDAWVESVIVVHQPSQILGVYGTVLGATVISNSNATVGSISAISTNMTINNAPSDSWLIIEQLEAF